MLLTTMVDSFLIYMQSEKNLSEKTVHSYNSDWQDFYAFLESELSVNLIEYQVEGIDHILVRKYLSHLNQRGLSKTTAARRLAALRSFFRYLVKKDFIDYNPILQVSTPKTPNRLPRYLEQEEMGRVLEQPELTSEVGLRDQAILELLYGAGIRVSEMMQMDLDSIDLSYGYVRVFGKGGRERIVPIGKYAVDAIGKYLEEARPKWAQGGNKALFLNQRGGRLSDRSIRTLVNKYCRQANTKETVSPHGFRHSFASHLLDNGADLRTVQELLGHKKISSTQIYTHVSQNKLRKVYHLAHPRGKIAKKDGEGGIEIDAGAKGDHHYRG